MGRVKSAKDLPEGVLEFESTPEGDIVYGKELESARKKQTAENAKKELEKLDTTGSKAKAIAEDVAYGVGKVLPGYGTLRTFRDRNFGAATDELNRKIDDAKKATKMKKGGKVKAYKAGGKVAGKLATRGYGCVKK